MNKLSSFIASLGNNPIWIAANAHFWFAFAIMVFVQGNPWVLLFAVLLAGVKEFIFDAEYEVPKQTNFDNWTDFAGYVGGALLGWAYFAF